MRDFELDGAARMLARTPRVLEAWLRGLPDAQARASEGGDSWSPFDVVGHLSHGERTDWVPRMRTILDQGTDVVFEPFDRFAQMQTGAAETLDGRLREFAALRRSSLDDLQGLGLTEVELELQGRHPEFGPVTLRQLLATWVAHDLTHLAQIARVLAKGYAHEVGPWAAYLPLLDKRAARPGAG